MPFKSKAQERFMFAKHPEIAKEFAAHTPLQAKLPERVHPKSKLVQYFENGGTVHSPSNPNESTILADSVPSMFRGPHTIELPRPGGGVTDIDPALVDKDVLDRIPMTQGPEPENYLPQQQPKGTDRAPAMLTPGEEVVPQPAAEKAREGSYGPLLDYFRRSHPR